MQELVNLCHVTFISPHWSGWETTDTQQVWCKYKSPFMFPVLLAKNKHTVKSSHTGRELNYCGETKLKKKQTKTKHRLLALVGWETRTSYDVHRDTDDCWLGTSWWEKWRWSTTTSWGTKGLWKADGGRSEYLVPWTNLSGAVIRGGWGLMGKVRWLRSLRPQGNGWLITWETLQSAEISEGERWTGGFSCMFVSRYDRQIECNEWGMSDTVTGGNSKK